MNLYLVTYENDGENLDMLVQGMTAEHAFAIVRNYWIEEFGIQGGQFLGNLHRGTPSTGDDVARIFQIVTVKNEAGVLGWYHKKSAGSVDLVGYVKP